MKAGDFKKGSQTPGSEKMQIYTFRCPSVTYARKGQKVLEEAGYRCRLTRGGSRGCSWGMEVGGATLDEITRRLEAAGVISALE